MRTIRIFLKTDITFELSFVWTNTALESMGKNKKRQTKTRERGERGEDRIEKGKERREKMLK